MRGRRALARALARCETANERARVTALDASSGRARGHGARAASTSARRLAAGGDAAREREREGERGSDADAYAFASAVSRAASLEDALRSCAGEVRRALGSGRRATWAQVYVSGGYDADEVARAGARTRELLGGDVTVVGGVVRAGVGGGGQTSEGVAMTAASMPGTTTCTFRAMKSSLPALDGGASWMDFAKSAETEEAIAITALADSSFEDVDEMLERLHVAMPNSVVVGGVLDEGSVMFLNDEVVRRGMVALLVRGDFEMSAHVVHGAKPIGPVMSLTQARDSSVLELDDTPAHPLLLETLETLPERAKSLPVMLGVGSNGAKGGPFVCRDILSVGETGGVELAHSKWNLREGVPVQLHIRDSSWANQEASRVMEKCASAVKVSDHLSRAGSVGAMIFACGNGNRMHADDFRTRAPGTPLGGAFVRSEIAPLAEGRASSVLSHTSAIGIYRKRSS